MNTNNNGNSDDALGANLRFYSTSAGLDTLRRETRRNTEAHLAALLDEIQLPCGARVADMGAGAGFALSILRERKGGGLIQVGADVSYNLLRAARAGADAETLLLQFDGERLPLRDGGFDIAMLVSVLHHVRDPFAALLPETARIIAPGGFLLIAQEPNPAANGPFVRIRKLLGAAPPEEVATAEYHQFKTGGIPPAALASSLKSLGFEQIRFFYTNAALADEVEKRLGAASRALCFVPMLMRNRFLSMSYSIIARKGF